MRNTDDVGVAGSPAALDDPLLRFAMLSVYHATLGRQFEIRGAPSVLLPPQVRPLELGAALDLLSRSPVRLREALWLVVRGARTQRVPGEPVGSWPAELEQHVPSGSLVQLRRLRREYRSGANVFAAALVACRDGYSQQFDALTRVLAEETGARRPGFSTVTALMLGRTAPEYLAQVASSDQQRRRARTQLERLEGDVGLNLYDFVEELADAAAFQQFAQDYLLEPSPGAGSLTVFPVSSVIRQDSRTLLTNATVTTLVQGDFATLCTVADPQMWSRSSDVIRVAQYVADAFDLSPVHEEAIPPVGTGFPGTRLLNEKAELSWGENDDQQGVFRNVLNIRHRVRGGDDDEAEHSVEVRFSLHRSIESAVLWDHRAGGLQLNQGYLKIRGLGQNTWRVTTRKVLRFSDRTPGVGGRSWFDLGQMLNYLAPAALTWWVESETYSMSDTARPEKGSHESELTHSSEAAP